MHTAVTAIAARPIIALLLVGITVSGLSACAPDRGGLAQPTTGSSTSADPDAAPTPTTTNSAGTSGQPFAIECSALLTDNEIFDFNNNFAADPDYTPAADSLAAAVAAAGGTACAWQNLSGGDRIEIAVSTPSSAQLATLKTTAAEGTLTTGLGDETYYSSNNDYGSLQVFSGPYWMTAVSLYFGEGGEANLLVDTALTHLP